LQAAYNDEDGWGKNQLGGKKIIIKDHVYYFTSG
jgi:hypothetical protein